MRFLIAYCLTLSLTYAKKDDKKDDKPIDPKVPDVPPTPAQIIPTEIVDDDAYTIDWIEKADTGFWLGFN